MHNGYKDLPPETYAKARHGDPVATATVLSAVEGLIHTLIQRSGARADQDDLLQEGRILAIQALRTFDPELGANFGTYLARHFTANLWRTDTLRNLVQRPQRPLDTTNPQYDAAQATWNYISLDAPISHDDDTAWLDRLCTVTPDQEVHVDRTHLHDAIRELDPQLRNLILQRLKGVSLAEIGRTQGYTREWARQLEGQAHAALRERLTGLQRIRRPQRISRPVQHRNLPWTYEAYRGLFVRAPNIVKPEKFTPAAQAFTSGNSVREVCRAIGLAKNTALRIRRFVLERVGPVVCACGKLSGHRGWCRVRYQRSARRQRFIAQWHQQQLIDTESCR